MEIVLDEILYQTPKIQFISDTFISKLCIFSECPNFGLLNVYWFYYCVCLFVFLTLQPIVVVFSQPGRGI